MSSDVEAILAEIEDVEKAKYALSSEGGLTANNFPILKELIPSEEWEKVDERLLVSTPTTTYEHIVERVFDDVKLSRYNKHIVDIAKELVTDVAEESGYVLQLIYDGIGKNLQQLRKLEITAIDGEGAENVLIITPSERAVASFADDAVYAYPNLGFDYVPSEKSGGWDMFLIKPILGIREDILYHNLLASTVSGSVKLDELYDLRRRKLFNKPYVSYKEIINNYSAFFDFIGHVGDTVTQYHEADLTGFSSEELFKTIKALNVLKLLFNEESYMKDILVTNPSIIISSFK